MAFQYAVNSVAGAGYAVGTMPAKWQGPSAGAWSGHMLNSPSQVVKIVCAPRRVATAWIARNEGRGWKYLQPFAYEQSEAHAGRVWKFLPLAGRKWCLVTGCCHNTRSRRLSSFCTCWIRQRIISRFPGAQAKVSFLSESPLCEFKSSLWSTKRGFNC